MSEDTDRRLENIENKLDKLTTVIEKVAVQKNRIDNVETRLDSIWSKYDQRIEPMIQGCPREQVKYLWWTVIPMAFVQLGMGLILIKTVLE